MTLDPESIHRRFTDRSLPKREWTHEAHLAVCWGTSQNYDVAAATDLLRDGIRAYNKATGTPNTDHDGYHESLTRYYVQAVASIGPDDFATVLASTLVTRTAPLDYWSRDVLFSVAARRGWVPPDRIKLPWADPVVA